MKLLLLVFATTLGAFAGGQTPAKLPSDREIHEMLAERIDKDHWGTGAVVGIISPEGRRIISYGTFGKDDRRPVDGDTIFEIGSVSKVFTSLLLSDLVHRGKVRLDQPVEELLPAGVSVPRWQGHQITLVDLSTQNSGLPFFPTDFPEIEDPSAFKAAKAYTDRDLYRFLASYQLLHEIGVHWEYSNLGVGLLGFAIARKEGMSYERLIERRIARPLGMKNTFVNVPVSARKRLSTGYDEDGEPAPDLGFPQVFDGAGSLRSNANDLLRFLGAVLGYQKTALESGMKAMLETRRPAADWLQFLGGEQALGWWVVGKGDNQMLAHAGDTAGFTASIAYNPQTRVGVVALTNCSTGGDQIAMHILRPSWPFTHRVPAPKPRTEITASPVLLGSYVGKYEAGPNVIIVVSLRNKHLMLMAPGSPMVRLHAESDRSFFIKRSDVGISFKVDSGGMTEGMEIHIPGLGFAVPAKRLR
jgi:CubicO group peptidase (beta-lactamase class C family)